MVIYESLNLNNISYNDFCTYHVGDKFDKIAIEYFRRKYSTEPSVMYVYFNGEPLNENVKLNEIVSDILGTKPEIENVTTNIYTIDHIGFEPINMIDRDKLRNRLGLPNDSRLDSSGIYLYEAPSLFSVVKLESECISIYYLNDEKTKEDVVSFVKEFRERSFAKNGSKTYMWYVRKEYGSYTLDYMEITPAVNFDIDTMYNDDIKDAHDDISKFIDNDKSGLVILHGLPGTGKTTYIRELVKTHKNIKFVYIPYELVDQFGDPAFIDFLREKLKESVLIVEDCEHLISNRTSTMSSSGIVNILNIADGMLGDSTRIKIICTFNADISSIGVDSALLRKGRLVRKYEFNELSPNKTKNLLISLGHKIDDDQEGLPLSEIFFKDVENNGKKENTDDSPVYFQ